MTTTTPKIKQQKKCPKCFELQATTNTICKNTECNHQFKPRSLAVYEYKPLIRERHGLPKLNTRTGEIQIDGKYIPADSLDKIYLDWSSSTENWASEHTEKALLSLASENSFDPVKEALLSLLDTVPMPLDIWNRLDIHLFGIDNIAFADFFKMYLVGAVARVFEPGCMARCVPVFISDMQEIGKSSMGRILYTINGEKFWGEGIGNGLEVDARMRCSYVWCTELAEIDGISRKADVSSFKAFISETEDIYRAPYGKKPERHLRNFTFWATANEAPLQDATGNSRFFCVRLPNKMLPLDWVLANRNALWSRALEQYKSGFNWDRPTEEQKTERDLQNEAFEQVHPWREVLRPYLEGRKTEGIEGFDNSAGKFNVIKMSDIYAQLKIDVKDQNKANSRQIKLELEKMGWKYGTHRMDTKLTKQETVVRGFRFDHKT